MTAQPARVVGLPRRRLIAMAAGAVMARPAAGIARAAPRPAETGGGLVIQGEADRPLKIYNARLLEADAKAVMGRGAYEFIAGGTGDETTLRANLAAMAALQILPRRLAGFSEPDLRTRLLELDLQHPFYVTPMGSNDLAHRQAELGTARGASAASTLYVASGASHYPMEAIAKAAPGPKWWQIYMNADPGVSRALLARARAAGYRAIVLTVDVLGPGSSDAYRAMGSPKAPGASFGNYDPRWGGAGDLLKVKRDYSPDDIAFVREASGLPVVVKGVVRPEDAVRSVAAGAAAVIVSNHGGRTLDGVPGAISLLRPVVEAVDGRAPVLFDSGARRGIDLLRALALGAAAVGVGRPVFYGLALGGAGGVQSVLEYFRDELRTAMLLSGARDVVALSPSLLAVKA